MNHMGGVTTREKLEREAIVQCGISPLNLASEFRHMLDASAIIPGFVAASAGGGGGAAILTSADASGGVFRLITDGGTSADAYAQHGGNVIGRFSDTDAPFYIAGRMKFITSTMGAAVKIAIGLTDNGLGTNDAVLIGACGAGSTTKFGIVKVAATVPTGHDLGTDLDTAMHEFRIWRPRGGGAIYARLDAGANQSVGTTGQPTAANEARITVLAHNGAATANVREIHIDWMFWAGERSSL